MTVVPNLQAKDERPPSYQGAPIDISAAFSNLSLSQNAKFPSKDQCIAHLKLLEAIHLLKEDIVSRDGLYGIHDTFVSDNVSDNEAAKILGRIREKRWQVFVCKAVQRFQCWFKRQFLLDVQMCTMRDMAKIDYGKRTKLARPLQIAANRLPPLDVLMVWHAFMLNPRTYLSDCIRFDQMDLWAGGMPWQSVDSVIDHHTLAYEPNEDAKSSWMALTESPWDSLEEPDTITITCPKCKHQHVKAWTKYTSSVYFTSDLTDLQGDGYADAGFKVICDCGLNIDHDFLRSLKFTNDLKNMMKYDIAMPGSLLNIRGKPTSASLSKHREEGTFDMIFPSRLLRYGRLASVFSDGEVPLITTPSAIRAAFEDAIANNIHHPMKVTESVRSRDLTRGERVSIRKMMACYWDNSSIFSMDLVGAVIRQGVFIEKMHDIDWLHSPALHSTIDRLLLKYSRFFQIMAKYPRQVAVPTLDVDLAWHTHQLSPQAYFDYSTMTTNNVFIDHDDKIAESKLNTAFEWTSKTYQSLFKSIYSECTCWYCEVVRENTSSHGLKRIFSSTASVLDQEVDQLHKRPQDPCKAPHISAHNAIDATDHITLQAEGIRNKNRLEVGYQRVVARAKKQNRPAPQRPTNAPYEAYPYWGASYVAPPACGSFATGAVGNCAAGTCGGTVSMGGCTGSIGSCAGAVAGCAGGSCGGGGGGCGGGGSSSGGGCGGGGGGGGCGGGGGGC